MIAAGIAVGLGMTGNILAPIVFLLLFNIPSLLVKYYGTFLGYKLGSEYVQKIYASGLMNILTKAASTVGLIMVGGMTISTSQQNRMKHFTITSQYAQSNVKLICCTCTMRVTKRHLKKHCS